VSELPTGAVTFLFTDIEGSTRLWEEHPDVMRLVLARHDAQLRAAIETNGGVVFKTVGDAFCAAFHTPREAVEAALAAQRNLRSAQGSAVHQQLPLKVRMAIHTGTAEVRDRDYFGPPLNRVARLLAAAHGGQVLLSLAAQELVRDDVPPTVGTRNLGQHRLRDLQRPEHVFQLTHPELPTEFPALRSLDLLPNNLPQQVTSFVGREKELKDVKEILQRTRLLTITGPGGAGKTRLSLHAAADMLVAFPDGVWVAELAPVSEPTRTPQVVATALGMKEDPARPLLDALIDHLRPKRLMLILDNCEHLIDAAASLAAAILRNCPDIQILASSREALNIEGEATYRLPSLALPRPSDTVALSTLTQYDAVRLFIERATAVSPTFMATNENAPSLAQICHQLDGIPLAIELAAARVRSFSLEELCNRLNDRFRLLTGGRRTALPRQQTLRATVDWSYDLLSAQERVLLRRLAVFAGGWTADAAEAVCADEAVEGWEVIDLLTQLVDKSLVLAEEQGGKTRYRALATVRHYARDRLQEEGELEPSSARHREWFVALPERLRVQLPGELRREHVEALESELDNFRAVLERCERDAPEVGLDLASKLELLWFRGGFLEEGRSWLSRLLRVDQEGGGAVNSAVRLRALILLSHISSIQGDTGFACRAAEEAYRIAAHREEPRQLAEAAGMLGAAYDMANHLEQAQEHYQEALRLWRDLGEPVKVATVLGNLGNAVFSAGDLRAARAYYEESMNMARELGHRKQEAWAAGNLAAVELRDSRVEVAMSLTALAVRIMRELGDRHYLVQSISHMASVVGAGGDMARAARLLGAAEAIRASLGIRAAPYGAEAYHRTVREAREELGEAAFLHEWEQGRVLTLEQAIQCGLEGVGAGAGVGACC